MTSYAEHLPRRRTSLTRHLNQAYATITVRDLFAAVMPTGRNSIENWFRDRFASPAFSYGSGRAALQALLLASGLGVGDEVIVCGFTCVAVPEAVIYAGATPVYADIQVGGWSSGVSEVEAVATKRTRAILVQHTYGIAGPVAELVALARRNGWLVFEDCALALNSYSDRYRLGSFGDAAIFSFEMTKTVTGGWGGLALVHDAAIAKRIAISHAILPKLGFGSVAREAVQIMLSTVLFKPEIFGIGKYAVALLYRFGLFRTSGHPLGEHPPQGWSYRLPKFHASLIARQLDRLDVATVARSAIAARYRRWLAEGKGVDIDTGQTSGAALIRFPILIDDPGVLVAAARRRGFELGRWFDAPVAPMPDPPSIASYQWGSCPRAEQVARQVVNLPLDPRMTDDDVVRLLALLRELTIKPLPLPC